MVLILQKKPPVLLACWHRQESTYRRVHLSPTGDNLEYIKLTHSVEEQLAI